MRLRSRIAMWEEGACPETPRPAQGVSGSHGERYSDSLCARRKATPLKTGTIQPGDLRGVFPVPPLARRNDATRSLDFEQNERIVRHIEAGGLCRILYGGNAMLYHITLAEYEQLLDWMAGLRTDSWLIPSAGPSYG